MEESEQIQQTQQTQQILQHFILLFLLYISPFPRLTYLFEARISALDCAIALRYI